LSDAAHTIAAIFRIELPKLVARLARVVRETATWTNAARAKSRRADRQVDQVTSGPHLSRRDRCEPADHAAE